MWDTAVEFMFIRCNMRVPDTLYHYTIGPKMPLISQSGELRPFGFGRATNLREKAVLWWSSHEQWEPTATKVISLDGGASYERPSLETLHDIAGCYRFRLDLRNPVGIHTAGVKLLPWTRLPLVARIAGQDVQQMIATGLRLGAVPSQWWGCLDAVPLQLEVSGLLRVDAFQDDGTWRPLTGMAEALALVAANPKRVKQLKASQTPLAMGK